MSLKKCKLVLKTQAGVTEVGGPTVDVYVVAKSINTLEFGIPGEELSRESVDKILKNHARDIQTGKLTVEFI